MSQVTKTSLITRIKETAMSGQGFTPAQAIELAELLDDNTRKTVKMSNEYHSRLTEIEKELFGYDRKGRLNPVSADPEALKVEVEPTQDEAANDADFDCGDCTACKPEELDLQSLLDAVFNPKLARVNSHFMMVKV